MLRYQNFHSVPRSKSALQKRKFNDKTFKGVSIIRRGANIQLPNRISKVSHVWNFFHHFLEKFSCYDFNTFGVFHGQNPRYPNKNSTLKPSGECLENVDRQIFNYPIGFQKLNCVWKSTFTIFCRHFRVTISRFSLCATAEIRVTQTKIQRLNLQGSVHNT